MVGAGLQASFDAAPHACGIAPGDDGIEERIGPGWLDVRLVEAEAEEVVPVVLLREVVVDVGIADLARRGAVIGKDDRQAPQRGSGDDGS